QRDQSGKELGFGLGFHVQSLDGHVKIGHGGAIYGFSTQAEALPERQLGIAAAASLDGSNGVVRRLVDFALRSLIAVQDAQELPEYRRTEPIAASRATELVGRYRSDDSKINAEIFFWKDQLLLRYGDFLHELRAAEDDGSIVIDDLVSFGIQVEIRGADGLLIGERSLRRVPSEPPPAVPERWRGLIGEYGWDHNTLYILEQDGQLYALIEWLYYYPLEELGLNEFAFPDRGLYHGERLLFSRDEEGYASRVVAAEVAFERRAVGTRDGETFRIQPLQPIEELRRTAMQAQPPLESGDFRDSDLVDLAELDASIKFDIRYAGTNNFMGARFYTQPRAFMQRPAAEALLQVQRQLAQRGLGLLIHDAYRPWHVTKMFWDATPADLKDFVANPANGSRHNRGCAVDLSLYDLESGAPVQMVSGYDEFSPRAYPLYPGGSSRQRWYRDLLRSSMEAAGFSVYQYEWWHFDFQDWQQYRIGNSSFEDLVTAP
ncbi:MAG: M15 family metallopeptidase, partial [bacterium]|nr:M15 family metallopeptidase [bacterium]